MSWEKFLQQQSNGGRRAIIIPTLHMKKLRPGEKKHIGKCVHDLFDVTLLLREEAFRWPHPLPITYTTISVFPWTTFSFGVSQSHLIAAYSNLPFHCPLPAAAWDERIFVDIIKAWEHLDSGKKEC